MTETFEFPLESELDNLKEFIGIEKIKQAYEKLSQEPHHKKKNILLNVEKSHSAVVNCRVNTIF